MPSSRRGLIALSLLLIVLGLIAWFEPGLKPPAAPQARTLSTLDPGQVQQLSLQRGGLRLDFSRDGQDWWLEGQPRLPANRFRLDKLLALLKSRERDRFAHSDGDDAAFGLTPPLAKLDFGGLLDIEVGGETAISGGRYLRIGETIHVVDDSFHYYLLGQRERFIAPALLPPGLELLAIHTPKWRLQHDGERWRDEPEGLIASADQAVALFDSWRHAQSLQLRLLQEMPDGGERIRLELQTASGEPRQLSFQLLRGERHWRLIREDARLEYLLDADSAAALIDTESH